MVIVAVVCVRVGGGVCCYQPDPLSNGGNRYGGVAAWGPAASPPIHWKIEPVFSFSNLAPLFLNFPVIVLHVCLHFPPSLPLSFSVLPLTPSPLWLSASSMFSVPVVRRRATVLSSSSVTAPLHILCMLYRQPNGGNQSTQMRLDSLCTLHSNQSFFHWYSLSFQIQPTNIFFYGEGGQAFFLYLEMWSRFISDS